MHYLGYSSVEGWFEMQKVFNKLIALIGIEHINDCDAQSGGSS